ncbi:hypothetical protein CBS76997_8769 [Aspergillus niger]|nr:hypothetical protein CBS13152_7303 [Aspergillus niger]KAI3037980.1 hypothetical protein CBS76997_8769 [Aspergillus niger]
MSTSWKYNCSDPLPEWVVNSDITGTGVLFSYIITAGIVVFILSLYYFVAYDPSYDPFQGSRRNNLLVDGWTSVFMEIIWVAVAYV